MFPVTWCNNFASQNDWHDGSNESEQALSLIKSAIYIPCVITKSWKIFPHNITRHLTVPMQLFLSLLPPSIKFWCSGAWSFNQSTILVMKVYSCNCTFEYSWEEVSTANWRKYCAWNKSSGHVISVDTLSRSVDPSTGTVSPCSWPVPSFNNVLTTCSSSELSAS